MQLVICYQRRLKCIPESVQILRQEVSAWRTSSGSRWRRGTEETSEERKSSWCGRSMNSSLLWIWGKIHQILNLSPSISLEETCGLAHKHKHLALPILCDLRRLEEKNPPIGRLQAEHMRLLGVIVRRLSQGVMDSHHVLGHRMISAIIMLTHNTENSGSSKRATWC